MTRMTWIAAATVAALLAGPALADDRQATQDQGQAGAAEGGSESTGGVAVGNDNSDGASADQQNAPAQNQPTMKDLLGQGYEVRAVTLVPPDVVKRGGSTDSVDAVMITMQNGAALATCYETYAAFVGDPTTLVCNVFK